jgi:protease secretion system membrane fusion protein
MNMKALPNNKDVSEVITHDVAPLTVNTDARVYARLGWLIVVLGVGGFLLWAMLAPLDKGVPMQGTIAVASSRKAIQHQTGGTVADILVKDGDMVKAGQVLVRMNAVQANSAIETSRAQYYSSRATEARLLAERDGKSSITFPASLTSIKDDPRVQTNMQLQEQLMSARQSSLAGELATAEASIAGIQAQTDGLQESMKSKKEQLAITKEQLDNLRDLAKDGYVARSRLLDVERNYAQLTGAIAEDAGNIVRGRRNVVELTLRRTQRKLDYQKEVRTQLSDTQKEAAALESRITGQAYELANTEVRAPVDGTVVGLNIFTRGGVVGSGAHLMDLVPSDDPLVVEGQLPVHLIDKVHVGLKAEMVMSAFNANKTPHVPGEVIAVAADRNVDEKTGAAYYKVKAKVTPEGMKLISHLQLRPGMPVELFVKTGERTMMSYLLKPVFDRAKTSLTEE